MPKHSVPTGEERQALFDELSATFARCSEAAAAIDAQRDVQLSTVLDAQKLIVKRDAAVRDATRKAEEAEAKADRIREATIEAANREFFEKAQAADARRLRQGIDLDNRRETALRDANEQFEQTIRAIHQAIASLQSIADAEKRARDDRDEAIGKAERAFRDDLREADVERQDALDTALGRQIDTHAVADIAHSRSIVEGQSELTETVGEADRALEAALEAIPAARAILEETRHQLERLNQRCVEQKRAIEARLRGDD